MGDNQTEMDERVRRLIALKTVILPGAPLTERAPLIVDQREFTIELMCEGGQFIASVRCTDCLDVARVPMDIDANFRIRPVGPIEWGTISRPSPAEIPAWVNLAELARWSGNAIERLARACYWSEQKKEEAELWHNRLVLASALEEAGCSWKLMLWALREQPLEATWVYMALLRSVCQHRYWEFIEPIPRQEQHDMANQIRNSYRAGDISRGR